MKTIARLILLISFCPSAYAQNYWQQAVDYKMEVGMNVETFRYSGNQELVYTNNSPDSLIKVFYHLYFNAFQPGREMAVRIKTGKDKNTRFRVDIDSLEPDEIGYLQVSNLKQEGRSLNYELSETTLEVLVVQQLGPGRRTRLN